MKLRVFLLILLTTLFCCTIVYGECPEGENWVKSYTDDVGNTYSLEAPCKVYIGIPFNITATVTSTYCGSSVWVAGAWQIYDNGEYILYGGGITTPWQKIVESTYYGTPIDHTIEFYFYDFPECTGFAHGWNGQLIGDVTVDPYPPSVSYSCLGFEPPLDKSPIKFKKNRVLPLKAQL
ncbi:MAG: hypothetical protein L6290_05690, partial [Thermodesulfovibrionales bacterium]|nr:hypothetical protein [Thermodesulfovibrionales bacterium]